MVRVIKTEVITPPVDTAITEVTADLTAESVAAATAIAEHYCHRQFLQRTVRVTYSVSPRADTDWLLLQLQPVSDIASVVSPQSVGEDRPLIYEEAGNYLQPANVCWGSQKVVVEYTGGYTYAALPQAIPIAVRAMARSLIANDSLPTPQNLGDIKETTGGSRLPIYEQANAEFYPNSAVLTQTVMRLLASYRLLSF